MLELTIDVAEQTLVFGTGTQYGSGVAWSNPGNIGAEDGNYATASLRRFGGGSPSKSLVAVGLDLSKMPDDATINGLEVTVSLYASVASKVYDDSLRLGSAGSLVGDEKADLVNFWPVTETVRTYGGPEDTWGLSLSKSTFTSTFGPHYSVGSDSWPAFSTAYVQWMQVRVYYEYSKEYDGGIYDGMTREHWLRRRRLLNRAVAQRTYRPASSPVRYYPKVWRNVVHV